MKLLQDEEGQPDPSQRRNHKIVEVQQLRDKVLHQNQAYQEKVKVTFDKHAKAINIQVGDFVLKWDARRKRKESMENLIIYGLVVSLSHKLWRTTHTTS